MEGRRLPIGIQTFSDIRRGGYVYVDKTALVYELTHGTKPYFLARPRRFGKSLLVSTLKAYFEGRRELFTGLKIAQLEKEWASRPVIHMDFSRNGYASHGRLKTTLNKILSGYEAEWGVTPATTDEATRLEAILEAACAKSGRQVAVLVDEYDKPMLDALQTDDYEANRMLMRDFYGVLKGCDEYLHFLFLTGITKFAKVNIFSELNQLVDISMSEKYGAICGITEEELRESFGAELEAFAARCGEGVEEALLRLKRKYDGYHFNAACPDIYNPFSLLNALEEKRLESYWFQTATPAMLFGMMEKAGYSLFNVLDGITLDADSFSDYRVGGSSLAPIIYHSGYLTIKGYDQGSGLYTLRFPNEEVRDGFIKFLLPRYTSIPEDGLGLAVEHFRRAIAGRDIPALMELFTAAVADLPTRRGGNMEYCYQVAFHAMLRQTGYDVASEQQVIGGRADVTLQTADTAYIFELKMDGGRPWEEAADRALLQIAAKGYPARFLQSGKKVYSVALIFSTERGGVAGYKVAE